MCGMKTQHITYTKHSTSNINTNTMLWFSAINCNWHGHVQRHKFKKTLVLRFNTHKNEFNRLSISYIYVRIPFSIKESHSEANESPVFSEQSEETNDYWKRRAKRKENAGIRRLCVVCFGYFVIILVSFHCFNSLNSIQMLGSRESCFYFSMCFTLYAWFEFLFSSHFYSHKTITQATQLLN